MSVAYDMDSKANSERATVMECLTQLTLRLSKGCWSGRPTRPPGIERELNRKRDKPQVRG